MNITHYFLVLLQGLGLATLAVGHEAPKPKFAVTHAAQSDSEEELKVERMEDVFTQTQFGRLLRTALMRTRLEYRFSEGRTATIWRAKKQIYNVPQGAYIYLDASHEDHFEVFHIVDNRAEVLHVLDLDGAILPEKTRKAIREGRTLPQINQIRQEQQRLTQQRAQAAAPEEQDEKQAAAQQAKRILKEQEQKQRLARRQQEEERHEVRTQHARELCKEFIRTFFIDEASEKYTTEDTQNLFRQFQATEKYDAILQAMITRAITTAELEACLKGRELAIIRTFLQKTNIAPKNSEPKQQSEPFIFENNNVNPESQHQKWIVQTFNQMIEANEAIPSAAADAIKQEFKTNFKKHAELYALLPADGADMQNARAAQRILLEQHMRTCWDQFQAQPQTPSMTQKPRRKERKKVIHNPEIEQPAGPSENQKPTIEKAPSRNIVAVRAPQGKFASKAEEFSKEVEIAKKFCVDPLEAKELSSQYQDLITSNDFYQMFQRSIGKKIATKHPADQQLLTRTLFVHLLHKNVDIVTENTVAHTMIDTINFFEALILKGISNINIYERIWNTFFFGGFQEPYDALEKKFQNVINADRVSRFYSIIIENQNRNHGDQTITCKKCNQPIHSHLATSIMNLTPAMILANRNYYIENDLLDTKKIISTFCALHEKHAAFHAPTTSHLESLMLLFEKEYTQDSFDTLTKDLHACTNAYCSIKDNEELDHHLKTKLTPLMRETEIYLYGFMSAGATLIERMCGVHDIELSDESFLINMTRLKHLSNHLKQPAIRLWNQLQTTKAQIGKKLMQK